MAVTLVEITAFDPVANAAVAVRVCNADDHRVTSLNDVRWWPVLARAPQRRLDLFDGDFSGQIGVGIGDLEITLRGDVPALAPVPRYSWGERAVTIWRGPLGGAWSDYVQVCKGLTRPARAGNGRMTIGLRPDDRWLDKPLLATYAGTGAIEGPAELAGVAKPIALGSPRFVPGVQINAALNIWQVHNGQMRAVLVVYDRLARYSGAAFAGDDATYAALAAATISAGSWRSCLALGLVRFGAPPAVPSFDVEGGNAGSYGWARRPGAVIGRIAELAGAVTATQIDSASLTALDAWAAALPSGGNISRWIGQQVAAGEIIQLIASSCNAAAGVGFDGKLFVAQAGIGTTSITLAADGSRSPAVAEVQMLETSAPFWRMAMAAEITERLHGESDYGVIGGADQVIYADGVAVADLQPAAPGADVTRDVLPVLNNGTWTDGANYLSGDIVTRAGSSYTALVTHTASAGNGPPGANWALLASIGAQGAVGVSAPPVQALVGGVGQFDPIRLTNGQTLNVEASLFLNTGGSTGTCTLELQISPAGAGSWATMSSGTASDTQPTTEPVELEIPAATFTNSSGSTQIYDVRAVSVRNGRDVNLPISLMRVI